MSLLREIQDAAIDSKIELTTLLRKCKVLAARLGNSEFKKWVENELNGYSDKNDLPEYRILTVNSKGHFANRFNMLKNADIPLMCIPEKFRVNLSHTYIMQTVASMQDLVSRTTGGTVQEPWDPDFVTCFGSEIYSNMNCVQAWKVISITEVVAALDSVRNRILGFVLEIETEAPDAGEAPLNSSPIPQERVQQIFNMVITGNVQNLATGSSDFKQTAGDLKVNDKMFNELLQAINDSKANSETIAHLSELVEELKRNQGTVKYNNTYVRFMSVLADHIQVFGPLIAPYLPALAELITK